MIGYFIFASLCLDREHATIRLPNKTIYLTGMCPIYLEEVELYQKIGLEKFWSPDGLALYDINRKDLAIDNPSTSGYRALVEMRWLANH